MKRMTLRTLLLLVELLVVVAAHQFLAWAPPAEASVVWLDEDPNEPIDPNAVDDPNQPGDPQPECRATFVSRLWLDDEPADPNAVEDPNQPANPQPEVAF